MVGVDKDELGDRKGDSTGETGEGDEGVEGELMGNHGGCFKKAEALDPDINQPNKIEHLKKTLFCIPALQFLARASSGSS